MNEALKRANLLRSKGQSKKRRDLSKYTQEEKSTPECILQGQAEELVKSLGLGLIRIPDNVLYTVAHSRHQKDKRQVSEYLKGVPDLCIFKRGANPTQTLFIELKKPQGKLSQGQEKWWNRQGVTPKVLRSFKEVESEIMAFYKGKFKIDIGTKD